MEMEAIKMIDWMQCVSFMCRRCRAQGVGTPPSQTGPAQRALHLRSTQEVLFVVRL